MYFISVSEDPPRPSDHSLVNNEMAGYMAGRGDFTTEYDNYMELDLRQMEFDKEESDSLEMGLFYCLYHAMLRK